MYKKILVPLDGSALAESVLSQVVPLAQCAKSEIVLLRVVTVPASAYMVVNEPHLTMDLREDAEDQAREYLNNVAAKLRMQGIPVSTELGVGVVADTIQECATDIHADLIAMSTHGRGGLARLMIGSVADHLVRHSHLPILLIHPENVK